MPLIIESDADRDAIFAKHYVSHGDAVRACAQARIGCPGYDMRDVAAYNLARAETKQAIAAERLKPQADVSADITRESVITDLQTVYEKCLAAGDYNPAITAKKTQAQLQGWLDQNVTLTVKHDVSSMSDEEIERRLKAIKNTKVIEGSFTDVTPKVGLAAIGNASAKT